MQSYAQHQQMQPPPHHQQERQHHPDQQQQQMELGMLAMHQGGLGLHPGQHGPGQEEPMDDVEVGEGEEEEGGVGGLLAEHQQPPPGQNAQPQLGLEPPETGLISTHMLHPGLRAGGANQLTLSYQGEMYLFDSVPPEKVRPVLSPASLRSRICAMKARPSGHQPGLTTGFQ